MTTIAKEIKETIKTDHMNFVEFHLANSNPSTTIIPIHQWITKLRRNTCSSRLNITKKSTRKNYHHISNEKDHRNEEVNPDNVWVNLDNQIAPSFKINNELADELSHRHKTLRNFNHTSRKETNKHTIQQQELNPSHNSDPATLTKKRRKKHKIRETSKDFITKTERITDNKPIIDKMKAHRRTLTSKIPTKDPD